MGNPRLDGIIQLKGSLVVPGCGNCNQNSPPAQITAPPGTKVQSGLWQETPKPKLQDGCVEA
jgi:hypothetical protein